MIRQMDLNDHPHTGAGRTIDPDTPKYEQLCELLTDDGHLLAELGDPITGHLLWLPTERIDEFRRLKAPPRRSTGPTAATRRAAAARSGGCRRSPRSRPSAS